MTKVGTLLCCKFYGVGSMVPLKMAQHTHVHLQLRAEQWHAPLAQARARLVWSNVPRLQEHGPDGTLELRWRSCPHALKMLRHTGGPQSQVAPVTLSILVLQGRLRDVELVQGEVHEANELTLRRPNGLGPGCHDGPLRRLGFVGG